MKRLILTLAVLLVASAAQAQEDYAFSLTAPQVASLDNGRVLYNRGICVAKGLAATCTQAQACVAYNAAGGASCSAAQANAAGCRIFTNTLSGRNAFISLELVKKPLAEYDAQLITLDGDDFRSWCRSASQAQQEALCTLIGKPASCFACIAWR